MSVRPERTALRALARACALALAATMAGHVRADALPQAEARFSDEAARVGRVLELANERLALMPGVAAWKWQHRAPVSDAARERLVVAAAVGQGAPLGLAAPALERLFALEIELAREEESGLERRWRSRGYDFAGRVPSLAGEVRPRLDRLTSELLRALYLAAPAFARADFAARYAPAAARELASEGWSDASRRALLEDLAGIRLTATPALRRIDAAHVLRIGTTGDYAPFSAESHGRLAGADIALARALARDLGAEPVFVRTSWPTLVDDLKRSDFDLAIGGISATPARAAAGALSVPYAFSGKTLIARCRDAARLDSLAAIDRPDVRVIVNPGGTNERYVRAHLKRARIRLFPSNATIFGELLAGRADVMITDDVEVDLATRRHPQLCRSFPGTLTHEGKVILMARDPQLAKVVDAWLRGALAAGTPARLLEQALAR